MKMIRLATLSIALTLALAACGKKGDDGPPCERLAKKLCEGGDVSVCNDFIAAENTDDDGTKRSQEDMDSWCASIVDDPSAVKVFKGSVEEFKSR